MLYTITSTKEISSVQTKFKTALLLACNIHSKVLVGFPGGSGINKVHYSSKYNFWFTSQKFEDKYWNAFGIGEPSKHHSNNIVVEINFSLADINRRIGGLIVSDSKYSYIAHRGKIGGGRAGIGKSLFFTNYNGTPVEVDDSGLLKEVFLISSLNPNILPRKISEFIHSVSGIKSKIKNSRSIYFTSTIKDYFPEYFGKKRSYQISSLVQQESRHGELVDKLKTLLVNKHYKVGKDKNRDLYIHNNNKITSLFEVKTNVLNQSIYSGVGQLLLYKHKLSKSCKLFLVLPEKLNPDIRNTLKLLGIKIIYYNLAPKSIRLNLGNDF